MVEYYGNDGTKTAEGITVTRTAERVEISGTAAKNLVVMLARSTLAILDYSDNTSEYGYYSSSAGYSFDTGTTYKYGVRIIGGNATIAPRLFVADGTTVFARDSIEIFGFADTIPKSGQPWLGTSDVAIDIRKGTVFTDYAIDVAFCDPV